MLNGKVAVVTGGSNGIGAATVRLLASGGASVWVFDRESPREECGARYLSVDVTSRPSIDAAFAVSGTPDILMVNAGIVGEEDFLEHTVENWERTLAVNLTGAFHSIQSAARMMKTRRSGAIVITASTNSFDGEARLTAYNASKAGLLGLLHTAANELGPYQIRINAVCPGLIRTRLTERHFSDPEVLRNYFRHIPLGRGGSPEEVAQACVFLASEQASYITGATLFVDGGQMASKFGVWNDAAADFIEGKWWLR